VTAREAFVDAARALVGLTEPSPELGALVDPGGDAAHQAQVQKLSLCMLTARGLWLRVLALPDDLSHADRPYVPGSIPAILRAILDGAGAARVPTLEDEPPGPGDGLWWAANGMHVEHVDACVTATDVATWTPDSTLALSVVAGGQRSPSGHETIAELTRTLRWDGSGWVCQATGRRLRWVLDCEALAAHYGLAFDATATLPTGAPAT